MIERGTLPVVAAQRISKRVVEQTEQWLDRLVAAGQLELAASHDRRTLVGEVVAVLQSLAERRERGHVFGEWLARQRAIAEVFADDDELDAAIADWLGATAPKRPRAGPAQASGARDPDLEARVIAEPHDLGAVGVYRDWLLEHGNPLGDLLAYGDAPKPRQQTLAAHAHYLWGPLHEYRQLFKLDWGPAGVHGVTVTRVSEIEIEWPIVIGWLLDIPLAIFLRELRIGPLPHGSLRAFEGIAAAILSRPRPALRTLHLDASLDSARSDLGTLAHLEDTLPNLRELVLVARRASIPCFDHRTLEVLALDLDAATTDTVAALATASCPALRDARLALMLIAPFRIEALFEARGFPSLARLELALALMPANGEQIVRGVLDARWLPQLRELDISATRLDDGAARLLRSARKQLAHLERLVVDVPGNDLGADLRAWSNLVHRSRSF